MGNNVSEEHTASIFRIDEKLKKETGPTSEISLTLTLTITIDCEDRCLLLDFSNSTVSKLNVCTSNYIVALSVNPP
jgi:hypothetical protein